MLLTLALHVIFAPSVSAQSHPCDVAAPSGGTVQTGAPQTAYFCAFLSDRIESVSIIINGGQPTPLGPVVLVTPTPNAAGWVQYSAAIGQFAKGTYTVTLKVYNRSLDGLVQESPASPPFLLSVVDPVLAPRAPYLTGIRR
ncbi:MAG TPA: hypothetical protein VGR82_17580 [Methylomirabilota bacterium]|nr:hypothetical protein [Methylomirabilota bacterium]